MVPNRTGARKRPLSARMRREELRKQIIAGAEGASMEALKNLPSRGDTLRLEVRREIQILRHVLAKPSQKALIKAGITDPSIQNRIFASYVNMERKQRLLLIRIAATKTNLQKKGLAASHQKTTEAIEKSRRTFLHQTLKHFDFKADALGAYIQAMKRNTQRIAAMEKTEQFPPQLF